MSRNIQRQALRITLLDDCVFSERNATVGGHRGLDRIPGQTLLGAAAARLYGKFVKRGDDAYTAFHSGWLRFLDGLPSHGKEIAYPVPLAWHKPKTGAEGDPTAYNRAKFEDSFPTGSQPKQMREGYVFVDGRHIEPARNLRLKTAIDPKTGHAAEAQLFGYESIAKGQTFIAWIEADEPAAGLMKEVAEALQGEVLLGRSRSAEYGRARVEWVDDIAPIEHGAADGRRLTIWLLSDLALADEHGRPTLEPTPKAFDFCGGDIVWDKTFLRSRRYSPWNAHRHGYDRERLLLTAGGVVTLELNAAPTADQVERLKAGIGLYREAGLGRLWINPPLLATETWKVEKFDAAKPAQAKTSNDPLIAWLREQTTDWRTPLDVRANQLAEDFRQQVRTARRLAGARDGENFGPSKSQWGRVLEKGRSTSSQALYRALFEDDSAVIKPTGDGWSEVIRYRDGQPLRLSDWLARELAVSGANDKHYAYLVRRLAHRLRQDTARKSDRKGETANG
jgi:CRISPR-associated protein Csx10